MCEGLCHIVAEEAKGSHFFVFRPLAAVVGVWVDADASTRGENACHFDIFRVHQSDEVFHDGVHAVFVEIAVIAETEQIEFQTLAFHHAHVGDVVDADFGKIGLTGDGAQAREFGAVEAYPIVVVLMFVLKRFQHFRRIVLPI